MSPLFYAVGGSEALQQRLGVEVVALNIFEIVESSNFEFLAGSLVANDDTVLVHLECADGPHVADRFFDSMLERTCLIMSVDHNKHFFGIHYRSHTYGE